MTVAWGLAAVAVIMYLIIMWVMPIGLVHLAMYRPAPNVWLEMCRATIWPHATLVIGFIIGGFFSAPR